MRALDTWRGEDCLRLCEYSYHISKNIRRRILQDLHPLHFRRIDFRTILGRCAYHDIQSIAVIDQQMCVPTCMKRMHR